MSSMTTLCRKGGAAAACVALGMSASMLVTASSHREAPFISSMPRVDGTDFYMFRSYQPGSENTVTLIANYLPLQDAYGGPNYFDLEDEAQYEIHIDNDGDAVEDITFRFEFSDVTQDLAVPVGGRNIEVPLKNIGGIGPGANDTNNVNVRQVYKLSLVKGKTHPTSRRFGFPLREDRDEIKGTDGRTFFRKPADNIGAKSINDYSTYANNHIFAIDIPGCGTGRVFVGQRREGFAVNLGEIFDLVNLDLVADLLGPEDQGLNIVGNKNITSLALEVPIQCVTGNGNGVIGGWTTASVRQLRNVNRFVTRKSEKFGPSLEFGPWAQVSRLGMPLVNEVVIGLGDKDRFNASEPEDDGQFLEYVQYPSLPFLVNALFIADARNALGLNETQLPTIAPTNLPRQDLVTAFLTGFPGVNQLAKVTPSEMLRLNTGINPTPMGLQRNFGVVVGDLAGFPNGRRPGDDVLDISLRVAMGALCHPVDLDGDGNPTDALGICNPADANAGNLPLVDGAAVNAGDFMNAFPYLAAPVAGSPSPQRLAP